MTLHMEPPALPETCPACGERIMQLQVDRALRLRVVCSRCGRTLQQEVADGR